MIRFVQATQKDFLPMLDLQKSAILAISDRFYSEQERNQWASYLDEHQVERYSSFETILVREGEILIGFVSWRRAQGSGGIECLYVLPNYQSAGLGAALLGKAEKELVGLSIAVRSSLNAQSFYEKYGYSFLDKEVSRAGFEIVVMEKKNNTTLSSSPAFLD